MRTSRTECRGEEGFALLEVLVAAFILVVALVAMLMTFVDAQRLGLSSERLASMTHIAQREIERLEGMPYADIGLNDTPTTSTDPANPDYYVVAGTPPSLEWDRTARSLEPLDIDTTNGAVTPVQGWSEGSFSGSLYDFVTWSADARCGPGCPSSGDYKRITVAVTITAPGTPGPPVPVYVSSLIADPNATPTGGIVNGTAGNPITNASTTCANSSGIQQPCESPIDSGNPNTYYLHDCAASNTSCPAPTGSSVTQQTVGVASGLQCTSQTSLGTVAADITGCPMPDLMDANPPAGDTTTTLYQYSTDLGTTGYPGGRLLAPTCANSSGCGTGQASDCNSGGAWGSSLVKAQSQFWVTDPLASSITLTGDGGINLFTQTQGGTSAVVSFCVEIYDVPPSGGVSGSLGDLLAWPAVALGGAGYAAAADPTTESNWPTASSQVAYTFNFRGSSGPVTIAAGDRLGVRVWMLATTNVPIALIYDNPLYPSEIQLNSQ